MDPEVQQAIDGWGQSLASGTSAIIVAGYKLVDLLQSEHEARKQAEEELESNRACNLYTWKQQYEQAIRERDEAREELKATLAYLDEIQAEPDPDKN